MADKTISALTAATTPLAGTEVLPIVQSSNTKKVAVNDLTVKNVRSNATTGLLQIAGPTAGTTRVMTTPDANFTVARTDAAQTFAGSQTLSDFYLTGVTKKYYWYVDGSDNLRVVRYTSGGSYEAIPFEISVNSDVKLYSGNLVIGTSGKGIDFSANTAAPGATSELLTWYEEGTWTPTLVTTGTQFTSVTYAAANAGRYTRVGNVVFIQMFFRTDAITVGSASGNLRISGLPFTAVADPGGQSSLSVGRSQDWVLNNPSSATVAASNAYMDLFYRVTSDGNSTVLPYTAADTANARNRLQIAGSYICA